MTRRQKAWILVGIFIAATLGAVSGYFYGQARLRRWARPAAGRDCHDFRDAPDYIGEAGCVEGRILDVYTSGRGNSFLNFCVDYQDCPFNAVIVFRRHEEVRQPHRPAWPAGANQRPH